LADTDGVCERGLAARLLDCLFDGFCFHGSILAWLVRHCNTSASGSRA
jgi:hypothetical protein